MLRQSTRILAPVFRPRQPRFVTVPTSAYNMSTAASAAPKRPRSASPADSAGAASTAGPSRALSTTSKSNKQWKRTRRARHGRAEPPEPYSAPDVLQRDIRDFLGQAYVDSLYEEGGEEALWEAPVGLERGTELEVRVGAFTVSGQSITARRCSWQAA